MLRELAEVVEIVAKDVSSGWTTFTWSDPSTVEWLTYLARRWGERAFSSSWSVVVQVRLRLALPMPART